MPKKGGGERNESHASRSRSTKARARHARHIKLRRFPGKGKRFHECTARERLIPHFDVINIVQKRTIKINDQRATFMKKDSHQNQDPRKRHVSDIPNPFSCFSKKKKKNQEPAYLSSTKSFLKEIKASIFKENDNLLSDIKIQCKHVTKKEIKIYYHSFKKKIFETNPLPKDLITPIPIARKKKRIEAKLNQL